MASISYTKGGADSLALLSGGGVLLTVGTGLDGGAGLNALSVDTFDNLQVPYEQLQPTKPFSGVTDGSPHR